MKYNTENEWTNFDFADSYVKDIEPGTDYFHIWLDNVKILPDNSKNRDIRTMRANNLKLSFAEAKISAIVREGVKIYDADGKPMGSRDDEEIGRDSYGEIYPLLLEGCVCEAAKQEGRYTLIVDAADESTYDIVIEAASDRQEWDRFLSPGD